MSKDLSPSISPLPFDERGAGGEGCTPAIVARCKFIIAAAAIAFSLATNQAQAKDPSSDTLVREILVPFDSLHVVLPKDSGRVMLSRDEYESLLKKAARTPPEATPPCTAMLLSADYAASISPQRAQLSGRLTVEVLVDGLQAMPLDLGGVGLQSASLDGRPASLGRREGEPIRLFVEGRGRHELKLEMIAPVETTAARQTLHFRLPHAPAGRLRLTVPGDVEIKGGAAAISREVDKAAGVTRFELLSAAGDQSVVMSLNSHLSRQQRAVVARSVFINEVTQAYERLHATVYLEILHQAVDRFQFAVPEGFEVTEVVSPLLARWAVEKQAAQRVLDVRLREPSTEPVVLNLVAYRLGTLRGSWSLARLKPLDVVGEASVFGLLVEERLKAESIEAKDLLPIDTALLNRVLPVSVIRAEPGAPVLIPVAAYYAPQSDYGLSAKLVEPPAKISATTSVLLILDENGNQAVGRMTLRPEAEKLFQFDLLVPPGWQTTSVTSAGVPLRYERYEAAGGSRLRVALPKGVAVDSDCPILWSAVATPKGWLGGWSSTIVEFPRFKVIGAEQSAAFIAVDARDDMTVRPEKLSELTPLDEAARNQYGLAGVPGGLAYRCEGVNFSAVLQVERSKPRLTARTLSFVRVEPDALACHDEIIYTIENARTRTLSLLLPESTPAALAIRGLDGVRLKEYGSQAAANGLRRWTVQLEEARSGQVRLAVDFQQPMAESESKNLALPIVRADGVAYQTGLLAVEGSAELDVKVEAAGARRVDVGELADAEYQPGRRLLGAFGFAGDQAETKVDAHASVTRPMTYAIPPAIVQHAELATLVAAEGRCVTSARFKVRAKASLVDVGMPADAKLWSAMIDGKPVKPNREGDSVLIPLPADERLCELQLVYEAPVNPVKISGDVSLTPPSLSLRVNRQSAGVSVPLADVTWHVQLPCGYEVVRTAGTLVTPDVRPPEPAVITVAKGLLLLSGGVCGPPRFSCGIESRGRREEFKSAETSPRVWKKDFDEPSSRPASPAHAPTSGPESQEHVVYDRPNIPASESKPLDSSELSTETLTIHAGNVRSARSASKPAAAAGPAGGVGFGHRGAGHAADKEWAGKSENRQSALAGVRSLVIDVQQVAGSEGRQISFHSLGVEPRLEITLVHRLRFGAVEWAIALLVGLLGIARTNRPVMAKVRFVVVAGLVAGVVPLVVNHTQLAEAANTVFFVVSWLVPYYLAAGLMKWIAARVRGAAAWLQKAVATAMLLVVALAGSQLMAAESPYVVEIVDPGKPVPIPADAILRPYDPQLPSGAQEAKNLLVPYERYVELWNRAYPDKKIGEQKPPTDYALAGVVYRTTLEGDEYLLLAGTLEFDIYQDGYVTIPLALQGGILARADLDGKPARLGTREVGLPAASQKAVIAKTSPLVVLHASGKGRHRLELEVRMHLDRRGGWRVAEGVLPSTPAASVSIVVPKAQTEVRLSQVPDRPTQETEKPAEKIETTLGPGGTIAVQWRPKVAEGQVDQSLSAHSIATLDVQEDGLRMGWQLSLEFRRSQREAFRLTVPGDCLVENIEGGNVRGWESREVDGRQRVDVTLLKPARDSETFVVWLARRGAVLKGELGEFAVPNVSVEGAALHDGRLTIRRSPLLDLRTLDIAGANRIDLSDSRDPTAVIDPKRSPLGLRPFQVYQFAGSPMTIRLSARPMAAKAWAQVQMVMQISTYERSMEAMATLHVQDRPIHQIQVFIPDDLTLQSVSAPGGCQWSVTPRDGRRLLCVLMDQGRTGDVPIVIQGRLGKPGRVAEVPLPRVEVLGMDRQPGDIAVQADPAFEVVPAALQGCQNVLREHVLQWLKPAQQRVTQLALSYRTPEYTGTLRLVPRKADVSCTTITNVRVTSRAVEETILLDYNVRNAGIGQLSFLLPVGKEEPRIQAGTVRQKTVTRVDTPTGPRLRVRLELQQEVMGELRLLVYNDRALTGEAIAATIPTIEGVRVDQQFVALETSGRDEVLVDTPEGLTRLEEQQKQWQTIRQRIGGRLHQAYLVTPGVEQPRLTLHTRQREVVQTAGARIGLAETHIVLDDHGAYRAQVVYCIDNTTEQFLSVLLPEGATLWTAQVAGEPVKPIYIPAQGGLTRLAIPLVKTAAGDVDYRVVLKYGGAISTSRWLGQVEFPLVHTVQVKAAQSQVWLHLPATRQWFNFGGKMRMVTSDDETVANQLAYSTEVSQRLLETIRHGDVFAKVRAASGLKVQMSNNLRQIGLAISSYDSKGSRAGEEVGRNKAVNDQAQQEVAQFEAKTKAVAVQDNRERLNDLYLSQSNSYTGNTNVQQGNFAGGKILSASTSEVRASGGFNADWFAGNGLATPQSDRSGAVILGGELKLPTRQSDGQVDQLRVRVQSKSRALNEPVAPSKSAIGGQDDPFSQSVRQSGNSLSNASTLQQEQQTLARYQQRLSQQQAVVQQPAQPPASAYAGTPQGTAELTKVGSGALTLSGANTYRGGSSGSDLRIAGSSLSFSGSTTSSEPGELNKPLADQPATTINAGTLALPGVETGKIMFGVGVNSDAGLVGQVVVDEKTFSITAYGGKLAQAPATPAPQSVMPGPGGRADEDAGRGLASLDVELPKLEGEVVYAFTTPRGELEITAWTVSQNVTRGLTGILGAIAGLAAAWIILRAIGRGWFAWLASRAGSWLLIVGGLGSMFLGVFPVLGFFALLAGIILKIRPRVLAATAG